jgi:predicted alpha/beta superfamily hydrolase
VLDANAVFGTVTETARFLAMLKKYRKLSLSVLAIRSTVLQRQQLSGRETIRSLPLIHGTKKLSFAVQPDAPEYVGSGGAANFLQFVAKELMPFVNTTYRTIPEDSAICGSSFGGLFALYVLFHQPDIATVKAVRTKSAIHLRSHLVNN